MNSKDYRKMQEAYKQVYAPKTSLQEEVFEFCHGLVFDTEEETQYFVEELFKDEALVLEFYYDVLSFSYGSETVLTEEVEYLDEIAGGLIKFGLKAARGALKSKGVSAAVKAMNPKTLLKKGIRPATLSKVESN